MVIIGGLCGGILAALFLIWLKLDQINDSIKSQGSKSVYIEDGSGSGRLAKVNEKGELKVT